jgi:hypothetical protein
MRGPSFNQGLALAIAFLLWWFFLRKTPPAPPL